MPAAAIVGAAVVGAGATVVAGNKAAKATKNAANQANETERYIFEQNRADLAPYREVGYGALGKLAGLYGIGPNGEAITPSADYGGFRESPGYRFRLDEGMKAIERYASSRGNRFSGATLKSVGRYADGLASSEYETFANRLASLAGVGQNATNTGVELGQAYAGNVGQNLLTAGNARASGYVNTGNAINSGVQNLASAYLYSNGYRNGGNSGGFGGFGGGFGGGVPGGRG